MSRVFRRLAACAATGMVAVACVASVGQAASYTWTGGTSGAWGTAGNWVSGTSNLLPTSGTHSVFYTGSNRLSGTVNGSYTLDSLQFNSTATGSYVITASNSNTPPIAMRGDIINQSGLLQTIGGTTTASRLRIDYGSGTATRLIDVGSGTIAFNAVIQSSPNTTLVKQGSGVLDLSAGGGAQAFTGTLSLAQGTTNLIAALGSAVVETGSGSTVNLNPNNASNYSIGTLINSGTAVVVNDVLVNNASVLNSGGTVAFKTLANDSVSLMTFTKPATLGGSLFVDVVNTYPNATVNDPQPFKLFTFSEGSNGSFATVKANYDGTTLTFSQNVDPDNPDLWISGTAPDGRYMTFNQMSGDLVVVPEPSTVAFAGIGCALAGWQLFKQRRMRQRARWSRLEA